MLMPFVLLVLYYCTVACTTTLSHVEFLGNSPIDPPTPFLSFSLQSFSRPPKRPAVPDRRGEEEKGPCASARRESLATTFRFKERRKEKEERACRTQRGIFPYRLLPGEGGEMFFPANAQVASDKIRPTICTAAFVPFFCKFCMNEYMCAVRTDTYDGQISHRNFLEGLTQIVLCLTQVSCSISFSEMSGAQLYARSEYSTCAPLPSLFSSSEGLFFPIML